MGLDLGLESAMSGIRTAVALENNPVAVETIKLNKPTLPVFNASIESVGTAELLRVAGLKRGEAFAVIGGPCCQSFSTVGKRKSLGDEKRGGLFRHFTRVVRESRPRFFVMENVKGVLSAAIRHRVLNERGPGNPPLSADEQFGSALKVICEELAELNYHVIFSLLNCADYGVPQKRYRVIFVGSRDGEHIQIPKPTHSESKGIETEKWVALRAAIGELNEDSPEYLNFTPERVKFLRRLKAGENWTDLPKNLQKAALGAAYESWGGRAGFCRRLDWHRPCPTLTTAPDGRATTLCHPDELRPLSIGEYAKLQQFPTEWQFIGTTRQKYIQIGNAVPIGLGRAVGRMLIETTEETKSRGSKSGLTLPRGQVVCADKTLAMRLRKRSKTKLNPPRMRKIKDLKAAREWMGLVAA